MKESSKARKARQRQAFHAQSRGKASSSTTGKSKGIVASSLQRGICARNRSWKRPDYVSVMKSIGHKLAA